MIALFDQADTLLSGPFWLAGCVLLGGGALVAWCARTPSWRVRIAELSFVGMVAWFVLALVPMPRLGQSEPVVKVATSVAVVSSTPELALPLAADPLPSIALPSITLPPASVPAWQWPTGYQVWLTFALLSFAVLLVGTILLLRLLSRSCPAGAGVQLLANQIGARLGLEVPADVRVHARLRAPFCCRLRTVVLPEELLRDRDALRAVLAHELAHVAARDPLRRTLQALLLPLFVLHPGYWLLRRMSTQASEEAADARAALALGRTAKNYARPLIELSERLGQQGVAPLHPGIVGVLGQPTSFTRRMTMLLTRDPQLAVRSLSRRQGLLATTSTLLVLGLSVGAWGTPAAAQSRVSANANTQDPRAKSPLNRMIRPDFRDCRLRDALRTVAEKTNLRMAIDTDVAARKIKIGRLTLDKMPARRLLDTLAVAHGLRWQMEEGRVVFRMALPDTLPIGRNSNVIHYNDLNNALRLTVPPANNAGRDPLLLPPGASVNRDPALLLPPDTSTNRDPLLLPPANTNNSKVNLNTAPESVLRNLFAKDLLNQGRIQEALRHCDEQLRRDPARADVLQLRAHALRLLGDEAGAAASFKRAQELHPEATRDALRNAASRALRNFADPQSANIDVLKRVRGFLDTGRTMQAIQECERALQEDPKRADLLHLQADAYRRIGDEDAARISLERAAQAGRITNKVPILGDLPLLGNVFRNVTENEGKEQRNRIENLYIRGRMDEALREVNSKLKRTPDQPQLWRLQANVLQAMGDNEAALRAFNKALQLEPDNPIRKVEVHRGPDGPVKKEGKRKVRVPRNETPPQPESPELEPIETAPIESEPKEPVPTPSEAAPVSSFVQVLLGTF